MHFEHTHKQDECSECILLWQVDWLLPLSKSYPNNTETFLFTYPKAHIKHSKERILAKRMRWWFLIHTRMSIVVVCGVGCIICKLLLLFAHLVVNSAFWQSCFKHMQHIVYNCVRAFEIRKKLYDGAYISYMHVNNFDYFKHFAQFNFWVTRKRWDAHAKLNHFWCTCATKVKYDFDNGNFKFYI